MARRSTAGGALGRYLLVRFLLIIPTVFILVTAVFVLMRATGDPITAALGGRLTADQLAERIHAAGYDRPILVQYVEYLGNVFRGDFGTTLSDNRPVTEVLTTYGTATLELTVYAVLVALVLGIPLGMLAAYFRDRWPDAVLRVLAIFAYATPVFFAGLLLKLIFAVGLGWFPVAGRISTAGDIALRKSGADSGFMLIDALRTGDSAIVGDVLLHAALPATALGLLTAGVFLRLVRTNMIGTLGREYVDAARSRGVGERRLVTAHAWRPALIPIITVVGLQIAMLLVGAVLTETTFEWRGLGFQLSEYLQARDFVAVQGIVALMAVVVAVTNFLVDVIAAVVDPRVRY
ncbi:binding-protein-dependent transport systems inner membrane component [Xylanimonas cellulosilytica DSM 15894]|uniref:Binding-protein-dependent transport systems inner membrane component n=1 Tax=Xylanimonas cellulosilytica (strain DSM 15894 / JCM 12276 / CECT 5975 / KCTC 9989 / LMG 20990 / NBRC 107835 / XIL07) TaxID=446471 RepID=D1C0R0_XYLCX|nr:ABC transporter permease [Xylanimonas cellulosilytica]ACZ32263.1 binding-protein-dependent transport systems inner membrane component [Xylanimonas cellulosilytica DSM 15894]